MKRLKGKVFLSLSRHTVYRFWQPPLTILGSLNIRALVCTLFIQIWLPAIYNRTGARRPLRLQSMGPLSDSSHDRRERMGQVSEASSTPCPSRATDSSISVRRSASEQEPNNSANNVDCLTMAAFASWPLPCPWSLALPGANARAARRAEHLVRSGWKGQRRPRRLVPGAWQKPCVPSLRAGVNTV